MNVAIFGLVVLGVLALVVLFESVILNEINKFFKVFITYFTNYYFCFIIHFLYFHFISKYLA